MNITNIYIYKYTAKLPWGFKGFIGIIGIIMVIYMKSGPRTPHYKGYFTQVTHLLSAIFPQLPFITIVILLMVQKSKQPPGMHKTLVNNGDKLPTSTGEFAGFLNHQPVGPSYWPETLNRSPESERSSPTHSEIKRKVTNWRHKKCEALLNTPWRIHGTIVCLLPTWMVDFYGKLYVNVGKYTIHGSYGCNYYCMGSEVRERQFIDR